MRRPKVAMECCHCGRTFLVYAGKAESGRRFCGNDCAYAGGRGTAKRPVPFIDHPEDPNAVLIPLTKGLFATVDRIDAERVAAYRWHARKHRSTHYAEHDAGFDATGRRIRLRMHRFVLGGPLEKPVDHWSRDGLDNRRANLREPTGSENQINRGPQANNTSGFKGVSLDRSSGRWSAAIQFQRHTIYLGRYDSKEMAARAYDAKALELFGTYAFLNFPEG